MSFPFFKSPENDSVSFDRTSAYDAEKSADSLLYDEDGLSDELSFYPESDRSSDSGRRRRKASRPSSVFQWISARTLAVSVFAFAVLSLCIFTAVRILIPIYRNGTEAEQKIAAENAALSEELSSKLQEIRQTLDNLNRMGILTAEAATVPDDSRLLYAVPQDEVIPEETDADLLTQENFEAVRDELEAAEATLKSFENDLSRYRSEQTQDGNNLAPQIDHLISELSAAKENIHTLQDKTTSQLDQFREDEGLNNERMIHMMNDLINERAMISSDIRSLRDELEETIAEMSRSGSRDNEALSYILTRQSEELSSVLQNSLLSSFGRLENSLSALQNQINADLTAQQAQLAAQEALRDELQDEIRNELPGILEMNIGSFTEHLDDLDATVSESVRVISLMLEYQRELLEKQQEFIEKQLDILEKSADRQESGLAMLDLQIKEIAGQMKPAEPPEPEEPAEPEEPEEPAEPEEPEEPGAAENP